MSTEAQTLLDQLRTLPENEQREIAECILEDRPLVRKKISELGKYRQLIDDGITDLDEAFVEAIMFSKGMK